MAQNFIESHREQGFLLPPDVRDWLAADHLAWFVIGAVAEMNLDAFYGAYRADGHGRDRLSPGGDVDLVRVRDGCAFFTGDRASVSGERCLSGDHRQSGS
jgi:hypothetical protein